MKHNELLDHIVGIWPPDSQALPSVHNDAVMGRLGLDMESSCQKIQHAHKRLHPPASSFAEIPHYV